MENTRSKPKRTQRSCAQIQELLAAFERSGSTQQAFCREHGISVATFSNWRRKAQAAVATTKPTFRPVRLADTPAAYGPAVRLPDGVELFFPAESSAADIVMLVKALKTTGPC